MGLLGGLAKNGLFGLAGVLLSKKKKKKDKMPTAAAEATGTPTGPAAVAANTQRRDMSMTNGMENRADSATGPRGFHDAFRQRAQELRDERREERRARRAARMGSSNNGGVGRFR